MIVLRFLLAAMAVVVFALFVLVGTVAVIGAVAALYPAGVVLVPLTIVVLFWPAVGIHELGHVLAARAAGLHVWRVVVGPVEWVYVLDCWRRRLVRPRLDPAGVVYAYPSDARHLRRRLFVYVAGGPVLSLLAGVLLVGAAVLWRPMTAAPVLLAVAGMVNLGFGLATLLPGRADGHLTDGSRLRAILFDAKHGERFGLAALVSGQAQAGRRPRAWSEEWVARLLALTDGGPDDALADLLGMYYALDRGETGAAGDWLAAAWARRKGLPRAARVGLALEGAFYEGYCRRNALAAAAWLARVRPAEASALFLARGRAAVALAEGRVDEARACATAALALPINLLALGDDAFARDGLRGIVEACGPAYR